MDTSAAVALVIADHPHHDAVFGALGARRLGLSGHAAFEALSVLTRLPPPRRLAPMDVVELLEDNFPESRFLSADQVSALLRRMGAARIGGGQVYDALVGAVAVEHGLALATRDRRAIPTYRSLGVDLELLA